MFSNLYNPDVLFNYSVMGMDQLAGTAADVANILIALFVAVVSVICLSPDMRPRV
jgi:uncharacterized membrane protein YtjA (UPF0391 family)